MTTPASAHDTDRPLRCLSLGAALRWKRRLIRRWLYGLATDLTWPRQLRTPAKIGASGVAPGPAADRPPAGEPAPAAPGQAA